MKARVLLKDIFIVPIESCLLSARKLIWLGQSVAGKCYISMFTLTPSILICALPLSSIYG